MATNSFPISQYSYAKTATARDPFDWHHQEFPQMKLSLTKPRGRLVMKILKKKDPLETIPVSELLNSASGSKVQDSVGSRARPVDVHYGEMQLAIVYATEDNQVKRVRVRLVDSDDLQTAVQLLRAAGCSVRNPLQKKTSQAQRPGTAATNIRPVSRTEEAPDRRPYTSCEQKQSSSSRPQTAASDRAERSAQYSGSRYAAIAPRPVDTETTQETYRSGHFQVPPLERFDERARPYSHDARPATRTGWPSEQLANLQPNSLEHAQMHHSLYHSFIDPSSQPDRASIASNALPPSGLHGKQQDMRPALETIPSFTISQRERFDVRTEDRYSISGDGGKFTVLPGSRNNMDDRVDREPSMPSMRQAWSSEQWHDSSLPQSATNFQQVANIDVIVPPRKLPFTSPAKATGDPDSIITPRRPHTVSTLSDNRSTPRTGYTNVSSSTSLVRPSPDESTRMMSPLKNFVKTGTNVAVYEDPQPEQRPPKRARHDDNDALGTGIGSSGFVAGTQNRHLQPVLDHQLNERANNVASSRDALVDPFRLSGFAERPVGERQKELEQQMLSLIDNDDFVALCEDIEISSARLALGD